MPNKHPKLDVKVVRITPKMAQKMLESLHLAPNRKPKEFFAAKLMRDIALGRWRVTTNAIGFDWNGRLIDGQNRLRAIARGTITVESLVVRGLDPDAAKVIDSGTGRTTKDILDMRDEQNTARLGGSCKWLYKIVAGPELIRAGRNEASPNDIEDILDTYPGIRDAVSAYSPSAFGKQTTHITPFPALHTVFTAIDPDLAKKFSAKLITGYNISQGDPVGALRAKLASLKDLKASNRKPVHPAHLRAWYCVPLAIKAWNATRKGKKIQRVSFNVEHEPFPAIDDGPTWKTGDWSLASTVAAWKRAESQ